MRFGCCLNMVAKNPDGTGIENIEIAAKAGFDYVELPLAEMMQLPEDQFKQLKDKLKSSNIRCEACNNFFPKTMRLTGEKVSPDLIEYVEQALNRAQQLGVEYITFGSGAAKNVPENFSKKEGYMQVVGLLKLIAPISRAYGITIVIEPLRKAECNIINTFAEACELAHVVNHENVRALVDYYHMMEEKEPIENLVITGKEYLRHVHFARHQGRSYPKKIDEEDYKPFIEALRAIDYNGRVSCEAYTKDFAASAPKAVEFFKENF